MAGNSLKGFIKKGVTSVVRTDKVAMFHPGRCGSTVLGTLLNQNPKLYWWGEPFEREMQKDRSLRKQDTIDIIREAELAKVSKVFSFATKFPTGMHLSADCINMTIPDYLDLLLHLGYKRFIYLSRLNLLKRAVSMQKGRVTGQWHTTDKAITTSVTIDTEQFEVGLDQYMPLVEYFKVMEEEERILLDTIGGKPLLILNYENDIEQNPSKAYHKTCEFFNVPATTVSVKLKKTNAAPLSELIANYEEVKKCLTGTSYAWMLEDE